MARLGQNERLVRTAHLLDTVVRALPSGDVVGLAGHRKERHVHFLQIERVVAQLEAAIGEEVVLTKTA